MGNEAQCGISRLTRHQEGNLIGVQNYLRINESPDELVNR